MDSIVKLLKDVPVEDKVSITFARGLEALRAVAVALLLKQPVPGIELTGVTVRRPVTRLTGCCRL